jgi:3'(2'), 5'-bisphosphate nucleotidase
LPAGGGDDDRFAHGDTAGGDGSGEPAKIQVGPVHPLHRKPERLRLPAVVHVHVLQVVEQQRPAVPRRVAAALGDVVAEPGGDRDRCQRREPQAGREGGPVADDAVEGRLVEADQVDLVHRQHHMPDAEQRTDEGVPLGLRQDPLPRIAEDDGEVGVAGAGRHVAGVLLVPRRVGDDEAALRRAEESIRDVDGDALLALGFQAIHQQGEVHVLAHGAMLAAVLGDGRQGVFHDQLAVVEQPADQRGLAVIHRPAGEEPEKSACRLDARRLPKGVGIHGSASPNDRCRHADPAAPGGMKPLCNVAIPYRSRAPQDGRSPRRIDRPMPEPADLLLRLVAIAAEAGARIVEVRNRPHAVTAKGDGSPLTDADLAAEAVIAAGLALAAPDIPVVSEEGAGRIAPDDGGRFLLVDPLDGTKEFLGPSGEFTVNIALIEGGRPVCGVVYAPALGRIWKGIVGQGASAAGLVAGASADGCGWHAIRARPMPSSNLVAVASRSHLDRDTEAFLAALPVGERRSIGSALKFCLLAEGAADVYPRLAPTMEWDTAAGQAVLEAAGGRVTTPEGGAFRYGKAAVGFRNGPFVAWGADLPA